jgi:predicted ATPase
MLDYVLIKNVCLAPELRLELSPRFNLMTGDNGLGKSFLLDICWWALTRTWAGNPALPTYKGKAVIEYVVKGKSRAQSKAASKVVSTFKLQDQSWPLEAGRPPIPGIVVYIRIDGGFSVWDPARNHWRSDPGRPTAFHFAAQDVWSGLEQGGRRVCEGLERDWVNWQNARNNQFKALEKVLEVISPDSEILRAGPPQRLYLGEGWDRPTLLIGGQAIPLALASAGIRRMLALAYFLVWSWHEHRATAELLKKKPEDRFVILFDEPETHLHPRWQRTVIPSLLTALDALRGPSGPEPQVIVATHAPLIAASLEPLFQEDRDDLIHLGVRDGQVVIKQDCWAKQGDATNWLVSDTFGLEQARSKQAEEVIEAAEKFMRGETGLPAGLDSRQKIHNKLQGLLAPHDAFWPRWIVTAGQSQAPRRSKK